MPGSPLEFYLTLSDFTLFYIEFSVILAFWLWSVWHLCAILREMKDHSIESKRIARWINERGLQDIAAFLLDVARPFGIFIAQTTYFLEPLMGHQNEFIRNLAAILEDSDQMEELMDQIDEG